MLLEKIEQSSDIKKLKAEDYPVLAQEIRQFLLEKDQPYRRSSGLQPGSRGADHGPAPGL